MPAAVATQEEMDDDQSALFAHRPDSLNLDEAWVRSPQGRSTFQSGCLGSDGHFSNLLSFTWFGGDDLMIFDVPEEGPGSMKWWWNPLKSSALVAWQEVFHDLKTGDGTRWDGSLGALGRRTAWELWLTSMTANTCWTEELPATMSSNYIVPPKKSNEVCHYSSRIYCVYSVWGLLQSIVINSPPASPFWCGAMQDVQIWPSLQRPICGLNLGWSTYVTRADMEYMEAS